MRSGLRVHELFGIPTLGGTVAARCEWIVPDEIARRAEGRPIHVASHVHDHDGRLLAHDGPRSLPVPPGAPGGQIVVPQAIPSEPGSYVVALDAVVEGKFWASSLGFEFPSIRIVRAPDGSLSGADDAGRPFRIDFARRFVIPHELYGAGESERCVEIPWVLSRYAAERRVLDIGTSFAEPRYLEALQSLRIPSLCCLDLVPAKKLAGRAIAGDARQPPLRPGSIDVIFAISVIEHIGRDNAVYLEGRHGPSDADGDLASIRALGSLLAPGGRLLVTVPFGRLEDHGWFLQYDLRRLDRLIAASGLALSELEFFRYSGAWKGPASPASLRDCAYGKDAVAANGLACFTLVRGEAASRSISICGTLREWLRRIGVFGPPQ